MRYYTISLTVNELNVFGDYLCERDEFMCEYAIPDEKSITKIAELYHKAIDSHVRQLNPDAVNFSIETTKENEEIYGYA